MELFDINFILNDYIKILFVQEAELGLKKRILSVAFYYEING